MRGFLRVLLNKSRRNIHLSLKLIKVELKVQSHFMGKIQLMFMKDCTYREKNKKTQRNCNKSKWRDHKKSNSKRNAPSNHKYRNFIL